MENIFSELNGNKNDANSASKHVLEYFEIAEGNLQLEVVLNVAFSQTFCPELEKSAQAGEKATSNCKFALLVINECFLRSVSKGFADKFAKVMAPSILFCFKKEYFAENDQENTAKAYLDEWESQQFLSTELIGAMKSILAKRKVQVSNTEMGSFVTRLQMAEKIYGKSPASYVPVNAAALPKIPQILPMVDTEMENAYKRFDEILKNATQNANQYV